MNTLLIVYLTGIVPGYLMFRNASIYEFYKEWTIADRRFGIFVALLLSWFNLAPFLLVKIVGWLNECDDKKASW